MINQLKINKMKNLNFKSMKKVLVVLSVALIMIGCKEDNTIEGRITRAMKEYAQKNFDDPKSLKEIVSIEKTSSNNSADFARNILDESRKIDSSCNVMSSECDSLLKEFMRIPESTVRRNAAKLSENKRIKFLTSISQMSDGLYSDLINKKLSEKYFKEIDSIIKNDTFYTINTYEIKVRVEREGQLKLDQYETCVCDTTTKIIIYPDKVPTTNFGKEAELLEKCSELIRLYDKRTQYLTERVNNERELLIYLR